MWQEYFAEDSLPILLVNNSNFTDRFRHPPIDANYLALKEIEQGPVWRHSG